MVDILGKTFQLLKKLDKDQQRIHSQGLPESDITEGDRGDLIIKGMDETGVDALNKAIKDTGYKGPGLNLERIALIFKEQGGEQTVDLTSMFANIKEQNKELFAYLRRPTQTMEMLIAMAQETGYREIVYKFLNRKPGEILPSDDLVGGLIMMLKLGQEIQDKALAITKTDDLGEKQQIFRELSIISTIQSNLVPQVSGNLSEMMRGGAVASNIQKLANINVGEYGARLNEVVKDLDEGLIDYHAQAFLSLPKTGKAEYAKRSPWLKGYDIAMEIYINALLSSPVTHIVNMAGNAMFQVSSTIESGIAGLIGTARTMGGRTGQVGDRVYLGEMSAEAYGARMALFDAVKSMGTTLFATGQPGDFATKIDLKRKTSIGSTDNLAHILQMGNEGDYLPMAINMLGVATRLPGRFLASEDEFFKVISKRKVLYREAYRRKMISYEEAIRGGVPKDKAKEMAERKYTEIILEPPQDIVELMTNEAKVMTFTNDPKGVWSTLVRTANLPGMKIIVPFSKTPTNIVKEVFDRTFNYSPIYKALKQNLPDNLQGIDPFGAGPISGREFDKALSKLVLGNSIFFAMASLANGDYGDEVIINGSGPTNYKARRYMTSAKVPQYSIGFKQDNGEYKYITFSRLDPLSGILAMASDYAYYSKQEDDMGVLMNLAKAGSLAIAEYAMNLPFLQGVSDIFQMAGNPYGDKDVFFTRLQKTIGELGTNVGMTVTNEINTYLPESMELPGASSFTRTLERVGNPESSNTMLSAEQIDDANNFYFPEVMKGFYRALNKAKAGNPKYSDQLEPGLDFWGNIKEQGSGKLYEYFSPIKIMEGGYTTLDRELIRLSERGHVFGPHRKKYNGIELSDKQYNRYVTLVNNSNRINSKYSLTVGDPGYDASQALLPALNAMINSNEYKIEVDDEKKYDMLNDILSDARESAMDIMLKTDDRLKILASEAE